MMTNKKKYFENLDASRFFAFVIVIMAHCFISIDPELKESSTYLKVYDWGKIGMLGLEYFFVLSSFLISWIILEEKKLTGKFNLKNFLARRTLRVWPLYFFIVFIGYAIYYIAPYVGVELNPIPSFYNFLFFIINFYSISDGTNFLFFLVFLWSISIEEQFYLFWSLIMRFFKINLLWISTVLIIVSIIFRAFNLGSSALYFHTLSAVGNFGIGGIAAYIAFNKLRIFTVITSVGKNVSRGIYLLLLLSIIFFHQLNQYDFFTVFSRLYFSILFGFYILEQSFAKNKVFNPGKNKLLTHLGKISYGLYCYHGVIITLLIKLLPKISYQETYWHIFILYPLLIVLLTIITATLSYTYFERYFLRLKTKFY